MPSLLIRSRRVSDTSSRRSATAFITALALSLACALLFAPQVGAKVFLSRSEAIELAFPGADRVEENVEILNDEQVAAIQKLSRAELPTKIIKLYTGFQGETVLGHAYIDVHTVRTQPEAFLIVLDPDGKVHSLRVLAFWEPLDYLPSERWVSQFQGRASRDPLRIGRDVHGIMGSTLSARAVTNSVRRVMAFYQVLLHPELSQAEGGEARLSAR